MRIFIASILVLVITSVMAVAGNTKHVKTEELLELGKKIYIRNCSFCHGINGGGDGPVAKFLNPRPRNFRSNVFKFRTTTSGSLPTDEDLFKTISRGIPGTAMQSFDSATNRRGLTENQRWAVIYHIQTMSDDPDYNLWVFDDEYAASDDPDDRADYRYNKVVDIKSPPPSTRETITKGKEVYKKAQCHTCHGVAGRGNGPSASKLKDEWKLPILPRDLTKGWRYKGGNEVADIFTRFTTGMNGTPMPSYSSSIGEEDRFALAHYVKSLQESVTKKRVLTALRVSEKLPTDPADLLWSGVEGIDIRLTGNVITKPRWQNITIDLVRIKAVFTDDEIAFRLEWNDRFQNREDTMALQFPVKQSAGEEKPHFLNGDENHPVNLWIWRADKDLVAELNATGYKNPFITQQVESQNVTGDASFIDGVWSVVMKRSLVTDDRNDTQFNTGGFIPLALNGWDGANGDTGTMKSISSWYLLRLEKPAPLKAFGIAALAVLLVIALEVYLTRRWRRDVTIQDRA